MIQNNIHNTAIIDKGASIGNNVSIGAYCVIGKNVILGNNVKLHSHVVIDGNTTIGDCSEFFPFCSIGLRPQDLKFKGENSKVIIGKNNVIREYVTINPGTENGRMETRIGDDCLLMIGVHIAHDCILGNNVIMANNATLAGHVEIGDFVIIGGLSAVHQFVRIGNGAIIGGMSGIESDVIPYGQAKGERAFLAGLNLVGLKRRGYKKEEIRTLRDAFDKLFSPIEGTWQERVNLISESYSNDKHVMDIINFLKLDSSRSVCKPKNINS